jgi:hypothetical protein
MKRQIFTLTVLLVGIVSLAQKTTESKLRSLTKLNLELQGFGISLEPRLGNIATMDFSAGIGTGGYDIWSESFTYVAYPQGPTAFISITPKIYYNRKKRIEKGKPVALNSGNYFGLRIKYTTRSIAENTDIRDALLYNAHWGMQRALSKKWTLNTHFGVGYAIDATDLSNSEGTFYPALDLKFSYIFNRTRG